MRITCTNPNHSDDTPSMTVYSDGAYCFACGWIDSSTVDLKSKSKTTENIEETFEYIQSLPTKSIRELTLPFDDSGYYILWPTSNYYKKRLWLSGTRYLGPRGHRAPLLELGQPGNRVIVVEGELNALSLQLIYPGKIVSPGSATEFTRHSKQLLTIGSIFTIVVDRDIPGVVAGLKLQNFLRQNGKRVKLVAIEEDYNQILQDRGKDGLREAIKGLVLS